MPVANMTAMPVAMNKKKQSRVRNRNDPDVPFGLEIIKAPDVLLYPKPQESVNTWRFHSLGEQFGSARRTRLCRGRAPPWRAVMPQLTFATDAVLELAAVSTRGSPWTKH